jgi:hypothetical protein
MSSEVVMLMAITFAHYVNEGMLSSLVLYLVHSLAWFFVSFISLNLQDCSLKLCIILHYNKTATALKLTECTQI